MTTSLGARLLEHADRRPDAVFCTLATGAGVRTITFGELVARGRAFAAVLSARGVRRGDVIPLMLRQGPELFGAFVGASLAGAIPSFMPHPSPKQRPDIFWGDHAALFERLRPRIVVTYQENIAEARSAFCALPLELLAADALDEACAEPDVALPGLAASSEDIACLQHSSGTTGLKKGVMLSHGAIFRHVAAYSSALEFTAADSIVSWLPLYHDMGFIACFMTSLVEGTPFIALDPFEWSVRPRLLLEAISAYRPTFCWLPNFAFAHLVNTAGRDTVYDLSSVRAFINCSEPCKAITFEHFRERFAASGVRAEQLHVCYAMAENVFAVTQTPLGRPPRAHEIDGRPVLSCGPVVDAVRVRVRGAGGELIPDGVVGEIEIASPFLFSGYYRQPEATAKKLHDGWYASGDLGALIDGELYVTGRIDDMLIVNGRNFYAHEIEALVSETPGVIPGRCVAIEVEDSRTASSGVVVIAETRETNAAPRLMRAVKETVMQHLGLSLNAVLVVAPGALIKTTSGKISRVANRRHFLEGAESPELVER